MQGGCMKKQNVRLWVCAVLSMYMANISWATEYLVEQKDKKFTKEVLKVKVGDSVVFKNQDAFNHNIFSLSDIKSFDLGSYPQGQARTVTMDKPGKVEVECSIHPDMKMVVEVTP
jgi:plastocyanin